MTESQGLKRMLAYGGKETHKFLDFYNYSLEEVGFTSMSTIVRVPETLTNFNPMCTFAGIAETYKAKHAWLGIRPC